MPRYDITEMTNADAEFYRVMGPFLSRREVVRAVGGPIWDDDGKTWTIATAGGEVAGFIGVTSNGRVESLYTVDADKSLAKRLVTAAAKTPGRLTAVVTHDHAAVYTASGFGYMDETVNFVKLERNP